MKNILYIIFALVLVSSCRTKEADPEPDPDPIPDEQEIVYVDTSGLTGELTVFGRYYDNDNQIHDAPDGSSISLYASYDDMINGLTLYNVFTSGDSAYFGYINYGNYYVSANTSVDTSFYYGEAAVQVRPERTEELTITMY